MYYLPTSCLVLFFLFSLFYHLPCASSKPEWCETEFQCGNISVGFPFWGRYRPKPCGHPWLELHCIKNITSLFISDQEFHVLEINRTSNTLRLARTYHQGSLCSSVFTDTALPPEILELSPNYKSLTVLYHCVSYPLDHLRKLTVNVPQNFVLEQRELDMITLESLLSKEFEVKVKIDKKACEECSSSGEFCSFNEEFPFKVKCSPLHPTTANELHRRCNQPFSCGNQRNLLYPFWIDGREDCGHPEFKLECNTSFAEVSISSVKYRILDVSYVSPTIRLARSDYINSSCPQNQLNPTFDENVLPFAPGTEMLTIYYDCRDFSESVSTHLGELACEDDDNDDRRNYYVTRNLTSPLLGGISGLLNDFSVFCNRNVSIPASGPALDTLQRTSSTENLRKALEAGFELRLNQECLTCIDSKGACGYNRSSNGFTCYYMEEPLNRARSKGISTGAKAGIVAATGTVIAILIAAGVFCLRSRRRKTHADEYTSKDLPITSYSSKESSRNPTSTTISSSSNHSLIPSISNLANASVYYGVQVFSYEELEEATLNFSRELGDGGFGTVYYGVLKDGRAVAVKRLYERSLKRVEQFKNEIEILKSLKHPNLVILYGCTSRHSRELLLVYEYISNGTLADHLHGEHAESRPLCWSVRLKVAIETAHALSFLHASEIIHRDVKTTNILLDENYQVKVADFGLSRLFPMHQTHISTAPQGTPGYVDPEYYQCYRLNEKSDVYSFGVVLTELISSKEAVDITRHRHDINLANMAVAKIQNNALHELVDPSLGFDKDPEVRRRMMSVAELAFRCLQQEREGRPSMDEVVEILRGINEGNRESPDVVDIEVIGRDDVGLLRHSNPPPISPETDKWTSSSDTAASY